MKILKGMVKHLLIIFGVLVFNSAWHLFLGWEFLFIWSKLNLPDINVAAFQIGGILYFIDFFDLCITKNFKKVNDVNKASHSLIKMRAKKVFLFALLNCFVMLYMQIGRFL